MPVSARARPGAGIGAGIVSGRAVVDVTDVGAVGDGVTPSTTAIQDAIDACVRAGGGTVVVPPGRYLVGTLVLGTNLSLTVERGATLVASTDLVDYPELTPTLRSYTDNYTCRSVIYAERGHNIAISGGGRIDGQGAEFLGRPYRERPYLMRFVECERVAVRDVELRDSAMWVQHYLGCRDVVIDAVTVHSTVNINNDGIDIDSSERVRVTNCDITSEDDSICLKATAPLPCRDVAVTNCTLDSQCNAFKIGTETVGDVHDVVFSNSVVRRAGLSGVAIESVDGGHVARIAVNNVVMRECLGGLFVRLGHRGRPVDARGTADEYDQRSSPRRSPVGSIRDVRFAGVSNEGGDAIGCSITGQPGAPVEDVTMRDVRLGFAGGGSATARPAELADHYPEYRMFGTLPAYGLYCRHVSGLHLDGVDLSVDGNDHRPGLVCDDVDALRVRDLTVSIADGVAPAQFEATNDDHVDPIRTRPVRNR